MEQQTETIETIGQQEQSAASTDWKKILATLLVYGLLAAGITVLFRQILMLNLIPSASMEDTLQTGSLIIANRLDCGDIQRYDIMVFRSPEWGGEDSYYIKRVIGLPGERITITGGKVYAGMELLDSSFLPEAMEKTGGGVYEVPEDCYFMLGDNRNNSCDSRYWNDSETYRHQYVPREDMTAKAMFSIWPPRQIGSLRYKEAEDSPGTENDPRKDCTACGKTACVVESDTAGLYELDGQETEWVPDASAYFCLACGLKTTADGRKILHAEGDQISDCLACGGMACVVEGETTGHYEQTESEPEWVIDGTVHYCLVCGEESVF